MRASDAFLETCPGKFALRAMRVYARARAISALTCILRTPYTRVRSGVENLRQGATEGGDAGGEAPEPSEARYGYGGPPPSMDGS